MQTKYQKRMTICIWISSSYTLVAFFCLIHLQSTYLGWLIFGSTETIIICLLVASDAIYDSLTEKLEKIEQHQDNQLLNSIDLGE